MIKEYKNNLPHRRQSMTVFGHFYLEKEKDSIVDLFMEG
jgi:hypothetical protein